jgi:response regulator NasT
MTQEVRAVSRSKIVLVDDDRLILATLGAGLRHAGYDTLEASSGEEAVRLCKSEEPDLAILDVRMPGMTGVEAGRQIRECCDVPYVFLSAYSDTELVRLAVEEGALGYLVKPMDVAQIVPSIEAALARAAELRKLRDSEAHLNQALSANRDTATAVGVVMERYRLRRQEAFDALRVHARSQRRRLEDVAVEMVAAAEALSLPQDAIARPGKK